MTPLPLLPSQTLWHLAIRKSFNPQQAKGPARSAIRLRPSSASSCHSSSSSAALSLTSSKSSSQPQSSCRRAAVGLVASLGYSAVYSTATSIALCDSNANDENNDDGDEDFFSKLKSKIIESADLADLQDKALDLRNNAALNTIATVLGAQISSAISSGIPTDLSYGFFAGYFSGLALKKIGKVASITLGASFLALQTLAYNGYIDVHHDKLQKEVEGLLDRNNDGVVDAEDLKGALREVQKVAGFGLGGDNEGKEKNMIAGGGGFGMGFLGGLRSG